MVYVVRVESEKDKELEVHQDWVQKMSDLYDTGFGHITLT